MESKFNQLNTVDEIIDFVTEKELKHTYYCHYSSISKVDKILSSECMWLSPLDRFNDLKESESAGSNPNLFGLCFSAMFSENLPMWYLYGGLTGKGARITFKKSGFNKWLKGLQVGLFDLDSQKYVDIVDIKENVKVHCHDIIYASLEGENCRLKYNGAINKNLNSEDYLTLKNRHKGFIKELPWFYEKEFRILVEVDDGITKLLKENEKTKLVVKLNKNDFEYFEIMSGPESEPADYSNFKGLTKFLSCKIKKSSFENVKMNLLRNNRESIVENFDQWFDKDNAKIICEHIRRLVSCDIKQRNGD